MPNGNFIPLVIKISAIFFNSNINPIKCTVYTLWWHVFHVRYFSGLIMKNSEREAYAKRVVHYYENWVGRNLKKVVEHFEKEGKRPQNITAIVKRYLINGTVEYRKPFKCFIC